MRATKWLELEIRSGDTSFHTGNKYFLTMLPFSETWTGWRVGQRGT